MFNYRKHRASLPRDTLAHEVAERSVGPTMRQLGTTEHMSAAELRGYVRAHALPFVCEEAMQLVSREWPRKPFDELVAAALEHATYLVVEQLKTHPVVAMPAPHVRLRIAA